MNTKRCNELVSAEVARVWGAGCSEIGVGRGIGGHAMDSMCLDLPLLSAFWNCFAQHFRAQVLISARRQFVCLGIEKKSKIPTDIMY